MWWVGVGLIFCGVESRFLLGESTSASVSGA